MSTAAAERRPRKPPAAGEFPLDWAVPTKPGPRSALRKPKLDARVVAEPA
jgi:hypothetical protein